MDVIDVEQQPAARPANDLAQKVDLAHRALGESDVGRGIFQAHPPDERLLHLVDVLDDADDRTSVWGTGNRSLKKTESWVDHARCSENNPGW